MRKASRHTILAVLFCFCGAAAVGQVGGYLTSPDGKPVAGADVFINNTKCYSQTDEEGHFMVPDVPLGYHEVVAYKTGFAMYRRFMRVSPEQVYNLPIQFSAVEKPAKVKSTAAMEEAFARELLGTDGKLSYMEGMKVTPEGRDGLFRVNGPVIVDYPAAGYRIIAFFSATTYQQVTEAAYLYQDIQVSNFTAKMDIEKTRQQIYRASLRHWLRSRVLGTSAKDGFQESDAVTVKLDSINSLSRISFQSPLKVTYAGQTSTLTATAPIEVNNNGLLLNPGVVTMQGAMGAPGLAHRLPSDYRPIDDIESEYSEALRYFYEKIYLHTDKPYYYQGDHLWFKAYVNCSQPDWRDSLSTVLHVELLNSSAQVKIQRRYPITRGVSHGDFEVPANLPEGKYYLRAYTNLRLNFGEGLFTKPIQVLGAKSKIKPDPGYIMPPDVGVTIVPGKDTYKVREKIMLDIQLDSGIRSANFSISVTDAGRVIPIRDKNILDAYDIEMKEISAIKELSYRIERGVSFNGQFLNDQGVGEKALLTFFQFKTGNMLLLETDHDGKFLQTGLRQPDSTEFSWKSDKAKGKPYGSLVIQQTKIPPLETVTWPHFEILQGGQEDYVLPVDSKLLETVEIKSTKLDAVSKETPETRPFGKANYSLTTKQLNVNSGNLLLALIGKVPGLVVDPTQRVIFFRRAQASSIINTGLPMVTLNNAPMSGDPYTLLESLDFNTIESIEFHNRINSLYGTAGAFGVISVYTKTGDAVAGKKDPTLQTIVLPGYSKAGVFKSPDYEKSGDQGGQPDQRSTLYWNPSVKTDISTRRASLSFYASDLSGMYRVVVEGVTEEGWPVRAETFIIVEEKK